MTGYEDLDDNGTWSYAGSYGPVWYPTSVPGGWAPYRYGHWVFISPWGWTWVDDAPWGFAPFHYGRWVVVGGVWGWVPVAPRPAVVAVGYVRPVYAPALVAWVGGPHFGIGVAVGGVAAGVAWFPLGPRDVFCPAYRVGPRYVENVNVYNTTIINRTQVTNVYTNVYVNKNVTNINYQNRTYVTATSQASFTSAQPVGRNMMRVDAREVASAPVAPLTPAVAPQQRSFLGAGAAARVTPPANVAARAVVARNTPPPAPISVSRQVQAVQNNGGRPITTSEFRQNQAPQNNVRVAQEARPAQLPPPGQRMNNNNRPAGNANVNPNQPPAANNNNRPAANINQPPVNNNRPVNNNQPNTNNHSYNDRPPSSRPTADPQVQQHQQQQLDTLRQQQDQERQRLEQKQVQQNQKLEQQKADDLRQQQIQQRQQQQLQQMENKHDQQQQKLQQRQQQETKKSQPSPKESKPPKSENKDHR